MTDERLGDDLQRLWQSQGIHASAISLDEIRERARRLEHRVSRRNLREYLAAVIIVGGFGRMMWVDPSSVVRAGAGLVIAATGFVVYHLHRRGSAAPLPVDLALDSALDFHRRQLERQRDLLRSVRWWYLLPFLPGMFIVLVGRALAQPERQGRIVAFGCLIVALTAGVDWLNRWGAARVQQRIDRLEHRP